MIRMKFNILIGMLCFLLTSCLIDNERGSGDASGQVDVTFSVTLPQPETVNTRAGLPYSDTDIKTVDVLVFDKNGQFMNRIQVDQAALLPTGAGVNFSVRLDATPDKRIIHLVANGRTADGATERVNFGNIAVGMSESEAISPLHTQVVDEAGGLLADLMPLVMWGRAEINGISSVSKAEGVKLLRTMACIQVKLASATIENGLNDFQIKNIALVGALKQGYVTPVDYASGASIPSVARPMGGSVWDVAKTMSNDGTPVLYTYEQNYSAPNYQGVIVSAGYKGQAGYYKVALVTQEGTPLNIVRNHRYTLTVTKVSGPGYADINTAIASAPSNAIKVSLTDDDEDFPCLVADGQHMMGVSNNSMKVYGIPTQEVKLGTVYSSRGVSPVLTVPADCNWLTNLRATALGGDKFAIFGRIIDVGQSARYTTLNLACDNLFQTMQVNYFPQVSSLRDSDSYLIILTSRNNDLTWNAEIVEGESDVRGMTLSATHSNPSYFPGIAYNSSLNSKYASQANLHVAMGVRGVVKMNEGASWNGVAVVSRVVVWTP